jgi:hypothetical protein
MDNSTGHQVDIGKRHYVPGGTIISAQSEAAFFQLRNLDDGGVTGLVPHIVQSRPCRPLDA